MEKTLKMCLDFSWSIVVVALFYSLLDVLHKWTGIHSSSRSTASCVAKISWWFWVLEQVWTVLHFPLTVKLTCMLIMLRL